jgi:hypothetical protein
MILLETNVISELMRPQPDDHVVDEYANILAHRRALGHPMATLDGQIASIAAANELALATRNVSDCTDRGLELVNPFDAGAGESNV